jgi:carboxyl-terminal processing protease
VSDTKGQKAAAAAAAAAVNTELPLPARVILDVDVVRESVFSQQVSSAVLPSSQGQGIGYLAIKEFTQRTLLEVNEAIAELKQSIVEQQGKNMEALVIDLRGNLGGPLPPALDVAALFLPKGSILIQMSAQGRTERYRSTNKQPDSSTQILLLTDAQTASASEIFAAALRDNHRATSMGSKTLGKNVAQVINFTMIILFKLPCER